MIVKQLVLFIVSALVLFLFFGVPSLYVASVLIKGSSMIGQMVGVALVAFIGVFGMCFFIGAVCEMNKDKEGVDGD